MGNVNALKIITINSSWFKIIQTQSTYVNTDYYTGDPQTWLVDENDHLAPHQQHSMSLWGPGENGGLLLLEWKWEDEYIDEFRITTDWWQTPYYQKEEKIILDCVTDTIRFDDNNRCIENQSGEEICGKREIRRIWQSHTMVFKTSSDQMEITFIHDLADKINYMCKKLYNHVKCYTLQKSYEAAYHVMLDICELAKHTWSRAIYDESKWGVGKIESEIALFQFSLALNYEQDIQGNQYEIAAKLYDSAVEFVVLAKQQIEETLITDTNLIAQLKAYKEKIAGNGCVAEAMEFQEQQITMTNSSAITKDPSHYIGAADFCDKAIDKFNEGQALYEEAHKYDPRVSYMNSLLKKSVDNLEIIARNQRMHAINDYILALNLYQCEDPTGIDDKMIVREDEILIELQIYGDNLV